MELQWVKWSFTLEILRRPPKTFLNPSTLQINVPIAMRTTCAEKLESFLRIQMIFVEVDIKQKRFSTSLKSTQIVDVTEVYDFVVLNHAGDVGKNTSHETCWIVLSLRRENIIKIFILSSCTHHHHLHIQLLLVSHSSFGNEVSCRENLHTLDMNVLKKASDTETYLHEA